MPDTKSDPDDEYLGGRFMGYIDEEQTIGLVMHQGIPDDDPIPSEKPTMKNAVAQIKAARERLNDKLVETRRILDRLYEEGRQMERDIELLTNEVAEFDQAISTLESREWVAERRKSQTGPPTAQLSKD